MPPAIIRHDILQLLFIHPERNNAVGLDHAADIFLHDDGAAAVRAEAGGGGGIRDDFRPAGFAHIRNSALQGFIRHIFFVIAPVKLRVRIHIRILDGFEIEVAAAVFARKTALFRAVFQGRSAAGTFKGY